jgi:hypothetical protein
MAMRGDDDKEFDQRECFPQRAHDAWFHFSSPSHDRSLRFPQQNARTLLTHSGKRQDRVIHNLIHPHRSVRLARLSSQPVEHVRQRDAKSFRNPP